MKYQLPQFIGTEVKLVGPFTLKQFLWLAGGTVMVFLLYLLFRGIVFWILAVPIGGFFMALSFLKVNDMPLINYIAYALSYALNPKKYMYKNEPQSGVPLPAAPVEEQTPPAAPES